MNEDLLDFAPIDTSQSEIKSWRRCHMKWFFKHVWRLRPTHTSRSLAIGSMVHETLAEWSDPTNDAPIRTQELLLDIFKDVYREKTRQDFVDNDFQVYKLVYRILIEYHNHYGPSWDFLLVEEEFRVPIFLNDQLVGFLHGRFDGLVRDENSSAGPLWIIEHKTAKRFTFDHLAFDAQADIYALAGSKLFGADFGGLWYDYIRTKPSQRKENFYRIKVRRSAAALKAIESWVATTMVTMSRAQPQLITPNFERDCLWFCNYTTLCNTIRAGVPLRSVVQSSFKLREEDVEDDFHG